MTSKRRARKGAKTPKTLKTTKKIGRKKPRTRAKRNALQAKALATRTASQRPALHWNPDADDVQRSVVQLVLTLVELVRKLMERQAIRRMEERTLTRAETEAVGAALMEIERTIRDIGVMFDITPEDLNLDLGAIKLL